MTDVAVIILAAGQSRRMGQPKMLLPWGKTTVLGQVVATFAHAGLNDIIVVTGASRESIEAEVVRLAESFPVRAILNEDYAKGEMLSSIQCGVLSVSAGAQAVLVALGDQPQVEKCTVRNILAAWGKSKAQVIAPSYEKRRGHPILIARTLWDNLLGTHPPSTLRDFLNAQQVIYIEAGPSILQDLDTPEDYERTRLL